MPLPVAVNSDVRAGHTTINVASWLGPESMYGKLLFRYWQITLVQIYAFRLVGSEFTEGRLPA